MSEINCFNNILSEKTKKWMKEKEQEIFDKYNYCYYIHNERIAFSALERNKEDLNMRNNIRKKVFENKDYSKENLNELIENIHLFLPTSNYMYNEYITNIIELFNKIQNDEIDEKYMIKLENDINLYENLRINVKQDEYIKECFTRKPTYFKIACDYVYDLMPRNSNAFYTMAIREHGRPFRKYAKIHSEKI
jgi:hypothetical protein